MEAGSEGEIDRNINQSPTEGSKRPKRQMKTPFQLEMLEKTYAMETYPSEATRAELSEKLSLTDRQLQMWFCHRRLKDKKESVGVAPMKLHTREHVGRKAFTGSPRMTAGSGSGSGSGTGSSQNDIEDEPVPTRYYESPRIIMERRVVACIEAQLGEPLKEDGPILGVEFDELPPGAFGAPIVAMKHEERCGHSHDGKLYGQYDTASNNLHEAFETKSRTNAYRHVTKPYLYDSPAEGSPPKVLSHMHENGFLSSEHVLEGRTSRRELYSHPDRQIQVSSPPRNRDIVAQNDANVYVEKTRKNDDSRIGRDHTNEKKSRKEVGKQDVLKRKREDQMKKEIERQDRERTKEEQRLLREQQRLDEKFQREERRENERREKDLQKELIRAEKRKQIEERRREKEAARQRAAVERATARRIAKESLELIEDERLELMELAASSKGLPSILSLDYDTSQNLELFRVALCEFPPNTVKLRKPFAIRPWMGSEENVGNLIMVWKFCLTFADVLGLWPFTIDEFIQAFHDYDSRLFGEIHISLLKLIIKDIEDVVRTPSGGPGTNQYTAVNPEGGHPHIVKGAYSWGFDIRNWKKHLNPLTWPEILRQFALSAGFGPQLKRNIVSTNDNDESRGCEEIVSTLRNGSAAKNAVAIMQEKGFSLQRKSKHRLTPGTVKFAAYHVLALEGSKGLNVIELAEKIQKSGLRDLKTSKTPEASISVALSRDPILFERIAPSTYCVRPSFRKDPADAKSIIAAAKEKILQCANGFLADQIADEEEREDGSESDVAEGAEVEALAVALDANKNGECNQAVSGSNNCKMEIDAVDITEAIHDQDVEIDESKTGELWVQGLTEGEYSDLSVQERLSALVALIGIANEGNSIRVILEDRMDAANVIKKQMWAEAQLDKRRTREETINKLYDSSSNATAEGGASQLAAENKINDPSVVGEDTHNSIDNPDISMAQFISPAQQNGHMTERSRLQLKSYIGHRAEEIYVYRSLPLGLDRRRNRYWQFISSSSSLDPGSGRIFVETPNGCWRVIDSEEAFDALLTALDTRGTRESHLHIMLQRIEARFKETVRSNRFSHNISDLKQEELELNSSFASESIESPTHFRALEPSLSFRIEAGKNEKENFNLLKRYQDLQNWMWKECFNSSIVNALAYGEKRCSPLLRICEICITIYDRDSCPCCHRIQRKSAAEGFSNGENMDGINSPLRIRLIKAILTSLEVSVPHEALHSSWTEELRKSWGFKLHKSSSVEGLLQILNQFEGMVKHDYLSADFETTEELLSFCDSRCGVKRSNYLRSVHELPWIPKTSAAAAMRLLELDASIFYNPSQKALSLVEKKVEALPNLALRYGHPKAMQRVERSVENNWGNIEVVHQRGGRPRGKSQKRVINSIKQSGKRSSKQTRFDLLGIGAAGLKHGRGLRTLRKRRLEKKVVAESKLDEPRDFSPTNIENEEDELDDNNVDENLCQYRNWGASNYDAISRSNEMMEMSEEEGVDETDGGCVKEGDVNLGGDVEFNDDESDEDEEGNRDDGSESLVSSDYSDSK